LKARVVHLGPTLAIHAGTRAGRGIAAVKR
jgi:hypothetical protein